MCGIKDSYQKKKAKELEYKLAESTLGGRISTCPTAKLNSLLDWAKKNSVAELVELIEDELKNRQ